MDKIQGELRSKRGYSGVKKFLLKLSKKELTKVLNIIEKIENNNTTHLDIKKLSGHDNIYRVRSGNIRIIFIKAKNSYQLIAIENKSDNTYKF